MTAKWLRFNRQAACPVCNHKEWCCYCPDLNLVLCMRVVSERPSKNEMGGYLHPLNGEFKRQHPRREEPPRPTIDAERLMEEFAQDTVASELESFAESLGVLPDALWSMGCQRAYRYNSWAFPMFGSDGRAVGIRLRRDDGTKFAVTGSRQGIFLPCDKRALSTAYIVEGASDLAALLTIGLYGMGRPQCSGCIAPILANLQRLQIQRVVIIADSDEPGLNGAAALVKELQIPSTVFIPPGKDLRQSVGFGLTPELLQSTVNSQVWTMPKVRLPSVAAIHLR